MAWLSHTPLQESVPCGQHHVQKPGVCSQHHYISLRSHLKSRSGYACARGNNNVALTTAQNKARLACTECVGWLSSARWCRTKHWPLYCCRCCWSLPQPRPSCPQQRRSPLGFLPPLPPGSPNPLQGTNPFYIRPGVTKMSKNYHKQWNHFISTPFFLTTSYTHLHLARHTVWAVANPEPLAGWLDRWMPPNSINTRVLNIFYSAGAQFSLSFMKLLIHMKSGEAWTPLRLLLLSYI